MLDTTVFERAIAWMGAHHAAELNAARQAFEARTAPIEVGSQDYESRISHFFETFLCSGDGAVAPLARYLAEMGPFSADDQVQLRGLLRSQRALVEVVEIADGRGRVRDLLLGGRYRVRLSAADRKLYEGDKFDVRLVPIGDDIVLSTGRVYHPREAHGALLTLLAALSPHDRRDARTLDALLRMRARFLAFQSIRVEHIYRIDALQEAAFAAPWARPQARNS